MNRLLGILLVVLAAYQATAAGLDKNGNSLDDVWEALYGALPPNDDPDGDGFTNAQESAAGTNPFDPLSHPSPIAITPWLQSLARFNWDAVAGKRYHILSRTNAVSGEWTTNMTLLP